MALGSSWKDTAQPLPLVYKNKGYRVRNTGLAVTKQICCGKFPLYFSVMQILQFKQGKYLDGKIVNDNTAAEFILPSNSTESSDLI